MQDKTIKTGVVIDESGNRVHYLGEVHVKMVAKNQPEPKQADGKEGK